VHKDKDYNETASKTVYFCNQVLKTCCKGENSAYCNTSGGNKSARFCVKREKNYVVKYNKN